MRGDARPSIERQLVDTDVSDAAKAVVRPDVLKQRHLPELTSGNLRSVERVGPTAPRPHKDRQLSGAPHPGLQVAAGYRLRIDGFGSLLPAGGNTRVRARSLSGLPVTRSRAEEDGRRNTRCDEAPGSGCLCGRKPGRAWSRHDEVFRKWVGDPTANTPGKRLVPTIADRNSTKHAIAPCTTNGRSAGARWPCRPFVGNAGDPRTS